MGFVTVGVLVLCFIAGLVANQFVVAARGETDDARLQQTTLTARKAEFKGIQDVLVASYDINVARASLRCTAKSTGSWLPTSYDQSAFIASLDGAATSSGTTIQSVSFGTAAAATLPSDASMQISARKVVAVPVTISAQGGYDALHNFVDQMQRIDRIAVPTSVSYSVADDDSQSTVTINSNILAILSSGSTQTNASSDAIENATSGVSK